jgi:ACR3 family arsenite transporter
MTTSKAEDLESQEEGGSNSRDLSAFKSLSWLDRLLALWIFLAMAVGIILGNFVPDTGPALEKGKFVGVSVPIGTC